MPVATSLTPFFAVSPDGKLVAVAGARSAGRIDLLDGATGKPVRTFREGDPVTALAFGPDGAVLGVNDGKCVTAGDPTSYRAAVRALSVSDGKELWERLSTDEKEKGFGAVSLLGFTHGDRVLFSSYADSHAQVTAWDSKTGKEVYRIACPSSNAAIGPGGKLLVSDDHGEVVLFDLGTGRETKRIEVNPEEKKRRMVGCQLFAWAADGRTLVTTLPEDHVCVLDPVTGKERTRFPVYSGEAEPKFKNIMWRDGAHSVFALALSPDGKQLLASAHGLMVRRAVGRPDRQTTRQAGTGLRSDQRRIQFGRQERVHVQQQRDRLPMGRRKSARSAEEVTPRLRRRRIRDVSLFVR